MKENEKNEFHEIIDEEFSWNTIKTMSIPDPDHKIFDAEEGVGEYKNVDGETKYAYENSRLCPGETIPLDEMLKFIDRVTCNGSIVYGETKSAPGYHKSETSEYSKHKNNG